MTLDDLDFAAAMLGDTEVMRYYPKPLSREEARAWVEKRMRQYREDGHALWLVEERATGLPVGHVGLTLQQVEGCLEPEAGWLIHRPYWRRGYATEAGQAAIEYGFRTFNYPHIISLIRPINLPSQGVARKLGMRIVREVMFHEFHHQVYCITQKDAVS
jgi:RimJ/RimL family protein N-acetyltransferase